MNSSLAGKVVVVTGGSRDIGRATVLRLAQLGATVVFSHSPQADAAAVTDTLNQVEANSVKAIAVPCDVTRLAEVEKLISRAVEQFGKVDLLINMAGGLVARKTVDQMDERFWDEVIDLNLKSVFLVCKAALPHMPDGSAIVNVSSQAGRDGGGPGALAYATAKGGLMAFTRGLAKELGGRRIRVNAVCPGMINTTFHNTFTKPEVRARVAAATPLGREGEACEVAALIAYLASAEASFVNGACIDINGGTLFS